MSYSSLPLLRLLLTTTLISSASSSTALAQQQYPGNQVFDCNGTDESGPNPTFLYTCHHRESPTCPAFLMFRARRPPYNSLRSIANLMASNETDTGRINNSTSTTAVLPRDTPVILPVQCTCAGRYYQANASYTCKEEDTYYEMARDVYQGLTTCDALMRENEYDKEKLYAGLNLQVPLRCACPTREQIGTGTRFMLTYLVASNDTLFGISRVFNVSIESIAAANGFASTNQWIYQDTTLLVPLSATPSVMIYKTESSTTLYPAAPQKRRTTSHIWVIIGIGIGSALAVLCFAIYLGFSSHSYALKPTIEAPEIRQRVCGLGGTLKVYTMDELQAATDDFSVQKRVSSSVYRGTHEGKLVAVKKTSKDVSKEIKILGSINHFNLITLYGVCLHSKVSYLVYEYMEGGSLKDWLREENSPLTDSWNHRILIALDVANGLDYLHSFTTPAYVHKDINSANILLNSNLRAKIANLSLAREAGRPHSRNVVGEKEYLAPEYMLTGEFTPKTDVYAFGMVLLELITGRDSVALREGNEFPLFSAVEGMHSTDEINGLIDPRLHEKHPLGYIIAQPDVTLRMIKLSTACLAPEPDDRSTMAEVVLNLLRIQKDVHVHNSPSY